MATKKFKIRVNVENQDCDAYDEFGNLRQEIIEINASERISTKWRVRGGFALFGLMAFEKLAKYGLTAEQYNVLVYMVSKVSWNNRVSLTQQEIADYLEIDQPRVAKAIKVLCEKRIIKKIGQPGKVNIYEFNHQLVVVGDQARKRSNQGLEFTY